MAQNADASPSVGELLAARRRERALELSDVEAATRVRAEYLDAIETMDRRRLPEGPYAAGFVRSYAQYLGLDAALLADRFRDEMTPRRETPLAAIPEVEPPPVRIEPPPRSVLIALAVLFGFLAVVAIAISNPPQRQTVEQGVPPVPEEVARWAAEDPARSLAAGLALVDGPTIALRARVPVAVEVRAPSGRVLFAQPMARDETYEVPPYAGLLVAVPNAGAVEVLRDGVSLGRMGLAGVPVSNWEVDGARAAAPSEPIPDQ